MPYVRRTANCRHPPETGDPMKKLLLLAAVAAVGYVAWQKYTEDRDERDLWAEVTDTFE